MPIVASLAGCCRRYGSGLHGFSLFLVQRFHFFCQDLDTIVVDIGPAADGNSHIDGDGLLIAGIGLREDDDRYGMGEVFDGDNGHLFISLGHDLLLGRNQAADAHHLAIVLPPVFPIEDRQGRQFLHNVLIFIEGMAAEIETIVFLFHGQAHFNGIFLDIRIFQFRHDIFGIVEEPHLTRRVVLLTEGPHGDGLVNDGHELGPLLAKRIHSPAFDEAFQGPLVDDVVIDAAAEIAKRREWSAFFAGLDDGFDGVGADALDAGQTEADGPVLDGEHGYAGIDIGRQDLDAVTAALCNVVTDFTDIVDHAGHSRCHEFRPIMGLEVRRLPGYVGISCRMGLVETIAGEIDHEVEYLVGNVVGNGVLPRPFQEISPLGDQDGFLFLAHGTAQQISLSQGKAAHDRGDLHDLFLVEDDAICILEDRLQQRVQVSDFLFTVTALDEIIDHAAAQRARTVEGDERDHVFKVLRRQFLDQVGNAR